MDYKTEQSRNHYNDMAQGYDESNEGKFTLSYNRDVCGHVVLKDNDTVLDAACGNGRLLAMLSQKARINAFGIDVSEEMIKAARKYNKNAVFNVCTADQTDFDGETFDLITVCCAFHHFSKPKAFMTEAYRILKRGGKLLISDPLPSMIIRGIENLIIPLFKMGDVKIYSNRELTRFFDNAGFKNIACTKKDMKIIIEGIKK